MNANAGPTVEQRAEKTLETWMFRCSARLSNAHMVLAELRAAGLEVVDAEQVAEWREKAGLLDWYAAEARAVRRGDS